MDEKSGQEAKLGLPRMGSGRETSTGTLSGHPQSKPATFIFPVEAITLWKGPLLHLAGQELQ